MFKTPRILTERKLWLILLIVAAFNSLPANSQVDFTKNQLVMRFYDFQFINFTLKKPGGDNGWHLTQSVYVETTPRLSNISGNDFNGAFRIGGEKHKPFGKRYSYYQGTAFGAGIDIARENNVGKPIVNLFGDVNYSLGVNMHLGKRFALGLETTFYYRMLLPITLPDDTEFELGREVDMDLISFTFIYKV